MCSLCALESCPTTPQREHICTTYVISVYNVFSSAWVTCAYYSAERTYMYYTCVLYRVPTTPNTPVTHAHTHTNTRTHTHTHTHTHAHAHTHTLTLTHSYTHTHTHTHTSVVSALTKINGHYNLTAPLALYCHYVDIKKNTF
jgi:ABC-type nickel/cobalt efflux system permease component RcnA